MEKPSLALVLRTALHLRPSQWAWRIRRKGSSLFGVSKSAPPPPTLEGPDPELFPVVPLAHPFTGAVAGSPTGQGLGNFTFLNQTHQLGFPHPDWRLGARREDRLWTVTLHYHSWAYALAAEEPGVFRDLVWDWIKRCSLEAPGAPELAWNPYAVATRIGWWCRSYLLLDRGFWKEIPEFHGDFLDSLWRQADYLSRHIEWDLRANHVLRDGLGLAWAGRFFNETDPAMARKWLSQSAEIFLSQIPDQVLPDGGHYERSPMYHLQVMEDLMQAALLLEDGDCTAKIRQTWERMGEYAAWARHPDGGIPLFNDAALNGAHAPGWMLAEGAGALGLSLDPGVRQGLRHFEDTGLVAWHGDPFTVFFDVGPLGPDEQPGHGHADNLTLEASWKGKRLFVDPGTYAYDEDEKRAWDRSTAPHNTLCIDGKDSSEVWKIFRVGRRAKPYAIQVEALPRGFKAKANHDGYRHLTGGPWHEREIHLEGGSLRLVDRVRGKSEHTLSGGFLLGPDWEAEPEGDGWRVWGKGGNLRLKAKGSSGLKLTVEKSAYHPEFGMELTTPRLGWAWQGRLPFEVEITLEEAKP